MAAANHLWADSMASWAEHQDFERERLNSMKGDYAMVDRHEHTPFGGCDCSLGLAECQCMARPAVADALPQDYDQGEQSRTSRNPPWEPVGSGVAAKAALTLVAIVVLSVFSVWCIASYLEAARV